MIQQRHVPLSKGRKRVFDSVFAPAPLENISPTPVATPVLGSNTAPGQSFGGFGGGGGGATEEPVPEQVTWDRAWHTATSFLSLPIEGYKDVDEILGDVNVEDTHDAGQDGDGQEHDLLKWWARQSPPSQEVYDALFYVVSPSSRGQMLRAKSKGHDLKEWYMNEARRHFLACFAPVLFKVGLPLHSLSFFGSLYAGFGTFYMRFLLTRYRRSVIKIKSIRSLRSSGAYSW